MNRGSDITVEVSIGPAEERTVNVPGGLVGGDVGTAQGRIQGAGLEPVIEYRPSDDYDEGTVMDVDPDEGAEVPAGSQVRVVASSGPRDIGFPPGDQPGGGGGGGGGHGNGNDSP